MNLRVLLILLIVQVVMGANGNKPVIIAHRGASGYIVEHTLASKAMAAAMGADYLEQDVVLSRDNVIIVSHDIILEHVSNVEQIFPGRNRDDGHYYTIDFSCAELKSLTLHERTDKNKKKAAFQNRFPLSNKIGFKIVTFEEEINFIQGLEKSLGRSIGLYVEIKSPEFHRQQGCDLAKSVLDLLAKYGFTEKKDKIFIQCFDFNTLEYIRTDLNSQLKLILLVGTSSDYDELVTESGLEKVAKICDGIGPNLKRLYYENLGTVAITSLVSLAHKKGLDVHPYTLRFEQRPSYIPSLEVWYDLLFKQLKVDGLFTDFPDAAVNYLQKI